MRILITGSEGLVGRKLTDVLGKEGHEISRLDKNLPFGTRGRGDVCDPRIVAEGVADCDGIVHLAAVSRAAQAERDPDGCWATNVGGTRTIVQAAMDAPNRPWVLLASCREVYGEPEDLPVTEDAPLQPVNIHGHSKARAESIVIAARAVGLRTGIARLSDVYGDVRDHGDRVVPSFALAAAAGAPMMVCGSDHTCDFTHVDDTARGLVALVGALQAGEMRLPPIHFLTGQPTTLGELASMANATGGGRSEIVEAPEREHEVAHFVGDARLAEKLLGWRAEIPAQVGVPRLARTFARLLEGSAASHVAGRRGRLVHRSPATFG